LRLDPPSEKPSFAEVLFRGFSRPSRGLGHRRREWVMTNPPSTPNLLDPTQASPALTAGDAERISTAIEAELAPSTRQMYAGAWRQWERWCQGRGLQALPASPEAMAAFLAERAEAGLTFGTLDGYCSGIARPGTRHRSRLRRTADLWPLPSRRARHDRRPQRRTHRPDRRPRPATETSAPCSTTTSVPQGH
jgi:hypothetical protein